jgi:hypothetical protein
MFSDLRYAFRQLIKNPGFAAVAILTLALGIGANSAIFSVVDPMLMRPLPFPKADRIVMIWAKTGGLFGDRDVHSYPDYVDLREQSRSFAPWPRLPAPPEFWIRPRNRRRSKASRLRHNSSARSASRPSLGRTYTPEEDQPGAAARVVVLTHSLWQRAFAGDPHIIGRQISLSARSLYVIGVMPAGWKFPVEAEHIDYVVPLNSLIGANAQNRNAVFLSLIGRLQPNVSIKQATAELDAISRRTREAIPRFEHRSRIGLGR